MNGDIIQVPPYQSGWRDGQQDTAVPVGSPWVFVPAVVKATDAPLQPPPSTCRRTTEDGGA